MRIGKIASSAGYRMEDDPELPIFGAEFWFYQFKKSPNSFIFQFKQFQKLRIWKIRKNFNLENSKRLQFAKLKKFVIWKIQKICNLKNS